MPLVKPLTWWRGLLVCVSWIIWPVTAFLLDLLAHLVASTSRGCSVEGCDFDPTLWELALYFLPPLVATMFWWRWRQHRRQHAA